MWRVGLLVIGLFVIPGALQPAWAQISAQQEGVVHAVSYREVPDRLAVVIQLYDDTDLDLQIREQMIAALRQSDHSVTEDALFELSLRSETRAATYQERQPSLGELSSEEGGLDVRMNVWSTTHDSLLQGRQKELRRPGVNTFEIVATLRERTLGSVVWEGRAIVRTDRAKAEQLVRSMVDSLVANLGKTVRGDTIPLR